MRAMIFAAGLGTRLRPLTNRIPKALVKVAGKPMLQRTIEHLKKHGFTDIIVNTHHHADQIFSFIENYHDSSLNLAISDESEQLLDTGGGLKKASWFFDDDKPFLVINADVISNLDLSKLYEYHEDQKALATLVVRNRQSSRCFLFNKANVLCGWKNNKTGETVSIRREDKLNGWPFSGIHMVNPRIFSLMKETGKFSIVNTYLDLAKEHKVSGFLDQESDWFDIGDLEKLKKAEESFFKL